MPPLGSEEDQRIIIEQCEVDNAKNRSSGGMITCTLDSGKYRVKYGVTKSLTTRIHTQPWLYSKAETEAGICVPELLGQFNDDNGRTYLVTKYVELVENPPPDMASKIAVALRWLASLTNEQTLGPLGGDHIVHSFFNEREALCAFKSLDALDRYIAKARTMSPSYKQTTNAVVLKNEPLVFTQCIVDASHFGIDKNGATVIMGFGSMSFVPHSLARYTLTSSNFPAVAELPNKLGWAGEANMYMLAKISATLAMTGNPTLGLDDNGMPITLKRKKAPTTAKATEDNERHRPRSSDV